MRVERLKWKTEVERENRKAKNGNGHHVLLAYIALVLTTSCKQFVVRSVAASYFASDSRESLDESDGQVWTPIVFPDVESLV